MKKEMRERGVADFRSEMFSSKAVALSHQMDAIMHADDDARKPAGSGALQQTKLVGQGSAEARGVKRSDESSKASRRGESQQPATRLAGSNILTWDNPYVGTNL